MKLSIVMLFLLSFQTDAVQIHSSLDCEICGEYRGGREFFSWTKLILKPNGNYTFSESRHTMQSIKDSGKWVMKDEILILNSLNKSKWESREKSKKKARFFFKKQICIVENDLIFIEKEKNKGFNFTYYTLSKIEK